MDEPKEFEYRNVEQYVESQLGPDEAVEFAQRVTTRRVLGEFHEVWDVRTTTLRLWVITNLTNYYLQDDFPSYEVALTYHLGVKVVLSERSRKELRLPEHEDVLGSAWRRHQQAVDAYNRSAEAEDYQAVGIHCREALLAVARGLCNAEWVVFPAEPPKEANFKGWNAVFAESLTAGRPRSYLKAVGDKTWDLVVSLQHQRGATMWDAELALDTTHHYLGVLSLLVTSIERETDVCPNCGSYRVAGDLRFPEPGVMETCRVCGTCEHEWDRAREDLS